MREAQNASERPERQDFVLANKNIYTFALLSGTALALVPDVAASTYPSAGWRTARPRTGDCTGRLVDNDEGLDPLHNRVRDLPPLCRAGSSLVMHGLAQYWAESFQYKGIFDSRGNGLVAPIGDRAHGFSQDLPRPGLGQRVDHSHIPETGERANVSTHRGHQFFGKGIGIDLEPCFEDYESER